MSTRDVSHSAESGQDRLNPLESIFEFHADPRQQALETGVRIGRFCHDSSATCLFLPAVPVRKHAAACCPAPRPGEAAGVRWCPAETGCWCGCRHRRSRRFHSGPSAEILRGALTDSECADEPGEAGSGDRFRGRVSSANRGCLPMVERILQLRDLDVCRVSGISPKRLRRQFGDILSGQQNPCTHAH